MNDEIVRENPPGEGQQQQQQQIISREEPQIAAHQLKLPTFWNDSPESWFIVAEAQFRACNITTENRRYTHLLASLPSDAIQQVRDIIQNPPDESRLYSVFKEKLLQRLTPNEEQRIASLLYHTEMGDRKPSEFFRHMQQLVGESNEIGRNTIRKLFISRLPKAIRHSLILLENQPINHQIEIADRLWEVETSQSPSIHSATSVKLISNDGMEDNLSEISRLKKEISELKLAIKDLTADNNKKGESKRPSRSHSRGRGSRYRNRSQSKGRAKSSSNSVSDLCWYHEKFGEKAFKCCKPCKFFTSSSDNATEPKN